MKVKSIVADIEAPNLKRATGFYSEVFGLELLMDQGWIRTWGSNEEMKVQISFATEGGSGTPVPDLSIEVDDIERAEEKVRNANIVIEYGPVIEPWGVRRFYIRDPYGKLINVMKHE